MKRARTGPGEAVTTVRPEYSISPDDDLYGSPRSWMGLPMKSGEDGDGSFDPSAQLGAVGEPKANLPAEASELARYYRDRKVHEPWLGDPSTDGRQDSWTQRGGSTGRRHRRQETGLAGSAGGSQARPSTLTIQLLGAVTLLMAAWMVFHSSRPLALLAQRDIRAMFKVDYTSIDLPAAVARVFGSLPSSGTPAVPASVPPLDFVAPIKGAIVRSFSVVSPEVVIAGRPGSPVVAAADGLVDNVGESQANGYYATIDHGSFGQTLYAHLARLTVHQHEYVVAGQTIGYLPRSDGHLTFGYIKSGSYRNPRQLLDAAK